MIQKNFGLLKISSRLVKTAAWTFFLFGLIHVIAILIRVDKNIPVGMSIVWLMVWTSIFFILYHLALLADLMLEIWQFLKKERF